MRPCLKYLGLTNKEVKKALDNISRAALRATYTLWLARNNKKFGSWELVARPYIPPIEEEYHEEMPTLNSETKRIGSLRSCVEYYTDALSSKGSSLKYRLYGFHSKIPDML